MVGGNNLITLHSSYSPLKEELDRLESCQRAIATWRAELVAEWDKRHMNYHQRMISKERFHQGVKANWKVLLSKYCIDQINIANN